MLSYSSWRASLFYRLFQSLLRLHLFFLLRGGALPRLDSVAALVLFLRIPSFPTRICATIVVLLIGGLEVVSRRSACLDGVFHVCTPFLVLCIPARARGAIDLLLRFEPELLCDWADLLFPFGMICCALAVGVISRASRITLPLFDLPLEFSPSPRVRAHHIRTEKAFSAIASAMRYPAVKNFPPSPARRKIVF